MSFSTRKRIVEIVEALESRPSTDRVKNPYAGKGGDVRRRNLARYLGLLARRRTRLALIGEAPSWRGGAVTGIPFAAFEDLCAPAVHGIPGPWELPLGNDIPLFEASARVVRSSFETLFAEPLLAWNIFPWHPHAPGLSSANRRPTRQEMADGVEVLRRVLDLVAVAAVIAAGRVAQTTLADMRIHHVYVRHPARGGALAFREGLRRLRLKGGGTEMRR